MKRRIPRLRRNASHRQRAVQRTGNIPHGTPHGLFVRPHGPPLPFLSPAGIIIPHYAALCCSALAVLLFSAYRRRSAHVNTARLGFCAQKVYHKAKRRPLRAVERRCAPWRRQRPSPSPPKWRAATACARTTWPPLCRRAPMRRLQRPAGCKIRPPAPLRRRCSRACRVLQWPGYTARCMRKKACFKPGASAACPPCFPRRTATCSCAP